MDENNQIDRVQDATVVGEPTLPASTSTAQPQGGLEVGSLLGGRYQIERELGRGGIGAVYLALDQQLLSRPVVVKILLEESLQNDRVVQKFRHEMEALTRLDHPGIIGILGAGATPEGRPYIAMQYVEGKNLREEMQKGEGMELERVANIMRQVGEALHAAHEAGVLHRDLKPENIMLWYGRDGREQVKLIDFGIAKVKDSVVAPSTAVPTTMGTYAYMSPEQLNARPVSVPSDVYALGVIAYELVAGRRPFMPETLFQLLEMQKQGVRVNPKDLRNSLSETAQAVILKGLAYSPASRYQSVGEFGNALSRALTEDDADVNAAQGMGEGVPPVRSTILMETPAGDQSHTPSNAMAPVKGQRPRKAILSRPAMIAAGVVLALAVAGVIFLVASRANKSVNVNTSPPPARVPSRTLDYWVEVQKYRDGRPDKEPFRLASEMVFQVGDHVWFNFSSAQAGYLYLINEGPEPKDNLPQYNLLFPTPTANNNSSAILASQTLRIPSGGGFKIDDERGTEKIWVVWSAQRVPELEAIASQVVTPEQHGVVSQPTQIRWVQSLITSQSKPAPQESRDDERRLSTVSGSGDVIVSLRKLEHY